MNDLVRASIEAAEPRHPSLVDQAHVLDELLGVVNVPSGTWIDESGVIVRPPEPAYPTRLVADSIASAELPGDAPPRRRQALEQARRIRFEPERYVAALRDWVVKGSESPFALPPDEVIRRSTPRPREVAEAAACFGMGQHLARLGATEDAVPWLREALRLQPENWTYKRQAWSLLEAPQQAMEIYGSDWLSEIERMGAERYYPALEL